MERETVISKLREHEPELRASGVVSLSVFGSVARGEARRDSDVDVLVQFDEAVAREGFAYFGRLDALTHQLQDLLGRPVDIVTAPVRKDRLRDAIAKEAARVF